MIRIVLSIAVGLLVIAGCSFAAEPEGKIENLHGEKRKEPMLPKNGIAYQFPKEVKKEELKGLKVNVDVQETDGSGGYFISLYAAVNDPERAGELKKIKLGSTAVFKPLKQGENVPVYIDLPKDNAWRADGKLWLCWEVSSADAKSKPPKVSLKISKIDLRPRKGKSK